MHVIDELNPNHITDLHQLYLKQWWSKERSLEQTQAVVSGSDVCIGLVDDEGALIGFTRVLSDFIFKALIFDVIVCESHRKKGLGDTLIKAVKQHAKLQAVSHFELYCLPEMMDFYRRHEFSTEVADVTLMRFTPTSR